MTCATPHANTFFLRLWCCTKQWYYGYERLIVWTVILITLTVFWYGVFALFGVSF